MKLQMMKRLPAFEEFLEAAAKNALQVYKQLAPEGSKPVQAIEAIFNGQMFMLGSTATVLSDLCDKAGMSEEESSDVFLWSWGIDVNATQEEDVEYLRKVWRTLRTLPAEVTFVNLGKKEKEDESEGRDV